MNSKENSVSAAATADAAEQARIIRQAIRDLSGLLVGGASIAFRVDDAEARASKHPNARGQDLMQLNPGISADDVGSRMAQITTRLEKGRLITKNMG